MRAEKHPSKMEYWSMIDDKLLLPILVGVEHNGDEVMGVMINNPNPNERGIVKNVRTITGVELLAVLKAVEESKSKVRDRKPFLTHIS